MVAKCDILLTNKTKNVPFDINDIMQHISSILRIYTKQNAHKKDRMV